MKKRYLLCFFVLLLLLFLGLMIGCGGGSNTVMTVIPTPTSNDGTQILSTLTEISSTSNTIPSTQGGTITHDKLTIEFPPGSLPSDSVIKIALVTINSLTDNTQHQGYKISTDSPDKVIELKEPAVVKLYLDSPGINPRLAFWDGSQFLPLEASSLYDSNKQELTIGSNYIYRDVDNWINYGGEVGELVAPVVLEPFYYLPKDKFLETDNFIIHYSNDDGEYASSMLSYFESTYKFYISLDFKSLHSFWLQPLTVPPLEKSKIEVYIAKLPDNEAGHTTPWGTISVIKGLNNDEQQIVASHELFHLVQYRYNYSLRPPTWFNESTTQAMAAYTFNHSRDNPRYYYDYKPLEEAGFQYLKFWSGVEGFNYSLERTDNNVQYYNFIFWSYIIERYGIDTFKKFIIDSSSRDLLWLDYMCQSIPEIKKELKDVYFDALEDYYIKGEVFNNTKFHNLSNRFVNNPYPFIHGLTHSYYAFSKDNNYNPFYNSSTVNLGHINGLCLNFYSFNNKGIFYLSIPEKPSAIKMKLFYFKNGTFVKEEEIKDRITNKSMTNFGTDFNDIYILIGKTSLTDDTKISFQAYAVAEGVDPNTPPEPNTPPPSTSLEFLSKSIPDGTTISPLMEFTQTYTFKNATTTLNNCRLYFDGGDKMNAPDSINLSSSISPGQEFSVDIKMTAPQQVGTYTNYWQVKDSSGNKIGTQISTQINCTADYMGQIVEQSANPAINLYQTKQITVKIRNTGTKPWNPGEVRLGTWNPQDRGSHFSHTNNSNGFNPDWLSDNRVEMQGNSTIQPGQVATFIITITDGWNPSTNGPRLGKGTYREEFKLVKDVGTPTGWFLDDNLSWDITVTDPVDYYCCWISQSPHPTVAKGGTKEITVKFKNLGKTAWNPSTLHLGADRPQDRNCGFYTATDSRWLNTNRIKMVETLPVQTGQDANFTFTITGNPPNGTYPEYFRLVDDKVGGQWFNEPDNVGLHWNITVGDAGGAIIVVDKKGGK